MKKTRYTEEQIAFALKQAETRRTVGISAVKPVSLKLPGTTGKLNRWDGSGRY